MQTPHVQEIQSDTATTSPPPQTAVIMLTPDYRAASWNPQAEHLTGYDTETFGQLDLRQLFAPADALQQVLRQVQDGAPLVSKTMQLRTLSGKTLPVEAQCAPSRPVDRNKARLVLVISKVAPLPAPSYAPPPQVLGHLAALLAHEIRNPLNAIFLHTDIVEEEVRQLAVGEDTQLRQSLATIKTEGTRVQALIQDYLCLARLTDLHCVAEDVSMLLADLIMETQGQLAQRGVKLTLGELGNLGEVPLHASVFRRGLSHLIQTLGAAMPPETIITVDSWRSPVHLQLRIWARDTVPSEARTAIEHALQTTKPDMADVGVYLAGQIMLAHGGEVTVTNGPDGGVMCVLTLPLDTSTPGHQALIGDPPRQ